jgi:hypothetical protein
MMISCGSGAIKKEECDERGGVSGCAVAVGGSTRHFVIVNRHDVVLEL